MGHPEAELESFLSKYTPEISEHAKTLMEALQFKFPTASRVVYDNYNALAIGFGPDDRSSNVILSLALYPKWVSLFFMQAAALPDPHGVLKGKGSVARHVILGRPSELDSPAIKDLIDQAMKTAKVQLPAAGAGHLFIKSVSKKQRPRRPKPNVS